MSTPLTICVFFACGMLVTAALHWCCLRAMPGESAARGGLCLLARAYCRLVHRLKITGHENLPADLSGPLVVISNHTGGLDPVFIQLAILRPWVRWMMADDMRMPLLEPFLNWMGNIWVDRFHPSPHALISAVRHLRSGGAIGIFPEGRVPEPAHEIRPFLPGLGHMVMKSKARVLVAIVDGTPHTHELGQDLFTRSNSTIHIAGVMSFEPGTTPDEASDAVRERLVQASGWPANDVLQVAMAGPNGIRLAPGQTGSGGVGSTS
ncbi:MAG: hypothetical protein CMJ28_00320 [Phycisphaerae bacterium]|nr:hypothetical protein [Phycisphaerae bacterium]